MLRRIILISCASFLWIIACGKQDVVVGNGPPKEELKKCTAYLYRKKYEAAVQCLEMFKAKFPNSEEATLAELTIGDAYYKKKDYLLAAESYEVFLKLYPYSPRAGYAHYKAGLAYSKEAPKAIDRDQTYLFKAENHLKLAAVLPGAYQEQALNELYSVQKRLLKRQFYIGRFYYKRKQYVACRPRLREVVNRSPDSKLALKSLFYLVKASVRIDELDDAKSFYSLLNDQFPNTKWTKKAEKVLLKAAKKRED